MPDILQMRAGETRQLRAPLAGVARWTSSAPAVVTTSDEDLVAGRPGGLLTAIKAGNAKITAFGYDNTSTVGEWDVEVAAAQASTLRVEKGQVAELPNIPGVSHWTIANPQVAAMAGEGRVRGISPGITAAHGRGAPGECLIEVSGTLEAEVNQAVPLAGFFSCPVRSWRTGSPSEVPIDSQGTITTGPRARTVEVFADLAPGREFQFRLRISAGTSSSTSSLTSTVGVDTVYRPEQTLSNTDPTETLRTDDPNHSDLTDPQRMTREEVENHLRAAETYISSGNWAQAGAELTAARFAAVTDPDLSHRVEQMNERMRARVSDRAATLIADVIPMLHASEYEQVYRHLDSARVPRELLASAEGVRGLTVLCERVASGGDDLTRETLEDLERQLAMVWGVMVRMKSYSALPQLADIGLQHGDKIVSLMIDAICDSTLSDMPSAIRLSLGKSLCEASALALESVVSKLANPQTPSRMVTLLQNLLPDLNLLKHASNILKFFGKAAAAERQLLVQRLSALHQNRANALLDLLAGLVSRMPPDLRLAQAIKKELGADKLESIAQRWATGGHRGARTVLERLYDYPSSAFR